MAQPASTISTTRRGALAQRLVELRMTGLGRPVKGLAVASAIGATKQSLWEWEHARHVPREQTLDRLARFFAQGDPQRVEELRSELFELRAQALEELHQESVQAPPGRRRQALGKSREARLTTLSPTLIREYAHLFNVEYLRACDELFSALAKHRVRSMPPVPQGPTAYAREALTAYYSNESLAQGGLSPYEIEINGRSLRLAVATRPAWVDLSIPLGSVAEPSQHEGCILMADPAPSPAVEPFRAPALRFLCDIETRSLEIYDAPIFRLMDLDAHDGVLSAVFCTDSFLHYRLTVGLLADELAHAVARARPLEDVLSDVDRSLPLRRTCLPDGASLAALKDRLCAGGVLTLLKIGRAHV